MKKCQSFQLFGVFVLLVAFFSLASGFAPAAAGQSATGAVLGLALDQQGAAVAGATVTLKNMATNAARTEVTNTSGEFNFQLVPPGRYSITVKVANMSPGVREMEVSPAASVKVEVTLGLQEVTQVVTVEGESGVAIQTENAQLGKIVSGMAITELPTIGRDVYDFMSIVPGAAFSNDARGEGFAVNGQRPSSGNFVLDGGDNNDTFVAGVGQQVPLDVVAEYQVQTNNYTAEYGRSAGFVANVVTKNGGNSFHGAAYEFNRNSGLAANTFNANAFGNARAHFNRNQFGGVLTGPIKRNKLFFAVSAEPIRVRSAGPNTFTVPTPDLVAISAPGSQAMFDPSQGGVPLPSSGTNPSGLQSFCPHGADCTGGANMVTINPFWDVTRVGPADFGAGPPQNTWLATGRVDWNINDKSSLFVRYALDDLNQFPGVAQPFSATLDQPTLQRTQNIIVNYTRTWSSNFITESKVGYNRLNGPTTPLVPSGGFPGFFFVSENATLPGGSSIFGGPQNVYQVSAAASWIHGKHSVRFGGSYLHLRDNRSFGAYQNAEAGFSHAQDFVNGIMNRYTIAIDPQGNFPGQTVNPPIGPPSFTRHFHYNEPALFIQDTWKLTPRLTLSPGLRWEYFGVLHSTGSEHHLDANFYYGSGSSYPESIANGSFQRTIDETGSLKGNFYKPVYNNFGPRLGLAWDITGKAKTVFRSGIGVFYDRNFGNVLFNAIQNPPNYGTVRLRNVPVTADLLTNQYAVFGAGSVTLRGTSARHLDQNLKTAYTVTWNASLEHQLTSSTLVGATYVGASGNRLYTLNNINRFGSGGLLDPSCTAPAFDYDANDNPVDVIGTDYTGCSRLSVDASSINNRGNLGHSSYHSLQLRADSKRLQRIGLTYGINYTFSHSIDNNSSFFGDDVVANPTGFGFLDAFDTKNDKGSSDFDTAHRLSVNYIWEVPLARHAHGVVKQLLGGWETSAILSMQTGTPFSIFDSGVADFTVETTRPRLVGAVPAYTRTVDPLQPNTWLYLPLGNAYNADSLCAAGATPFACDVSVNGPQSGNISRNTFRRPGVHYENMNIAKNFALRESMKLTFSAGFFDVFNHPNLYVSSFTNDVFANSFNGFSTPGVTASRGQSSSATPFQGVRNQDNREIVLGLKLSF